MPGQSHVVGQFFLKPIGYKDWEGFFPKTIFPLQRIELEPAPGYCNGGLTAIPSPGRSETLRQNASLDEQNKRFLGNIGMNLYFLAKWAHPGWADAKGNRLGWTFHRGKSRCRLNIRIR